MHLQMLSLSVKQWPNATIVAHTHLLNDIGADLIKVESVDLGFCQHTCNCFTKHARADVAMTMLQLPMHCPGAA